MKILITGDMGCIGAELKKQLEGHDLMLIDKKRGDHQDLAITEALPMVLSSFEPEVIFHLAASFERAKETPEAFSHIWHNDTVGSHRLIDAVISCPSVKTFVFASSYLIYDQKEHLGKLFEPPYGWGDDPQNLCGMSKLYTERELEFIAKNIRPDLRIVNARIFRVYGHGSKAIVNRWIEFKEAGFPAHVFNEENRFDFIHSRDVAEGLKRLAESDVRGIVNLGTGESHSIKELYELIGLNPEKISDDPESESSCADISKLTKFTNWKPGITLSQGIDELKASGLNNLSK